MKKDCYWPGEAVGDEKEVVKSVKETGKACEGSILV